MSGTICFLVVDEPPRNRWRIAVTSRPVLEFARAESKRLGVKVYPAHTPLYGSEKDVRRIEAYLVNYSQGDGWYGPLSEETMRALATRIRKETPTFLDGVPLEKEHP